MAFSGRTGSWNGSIGSVLSMMKSLESGTNSTTDTRRRKAAASFNAALRRLVSVVLFVPLSSDFIIERTEPMDPFQEPVLPLNAIAQYRKDFLPGKRVHVKGVVTLQRPGEDLFLEDNTG